MPSVHTDKEQWIALITVVLVLALLAGMTVTIQRILAAHREVLGLVIERQLKTLTDETTILLNKFFT